VDAVLVEVLIRYPETGVKTDFVPAIAAAHIMDDVLYDDLCFSGPVSVGIAYPRRDAAETVTLQLTLGITGISTFAPPSANEIRTAIYAHTAQAGYRASVVAVHTCYLPIEAMCDIYDPLLFIEMHATLAR
jgi:uncharacterized radical SAM superfamily protein